MVLRGTQSIPVIKQVTFVSEDSFIKAIVLENVSATFDVIWEQKHWFEQCRIGGREAPQHWLIDKHLKLHVSDVSMSNPKSYDCYDLHPNKRRKLN